MATRKTAQVETGRPTTYQEPLDKRKPIMFTGSQIAEIQKSCGPDVDFGAFVRTAALEKVRGGFAPMISPSLADELKEVIKGTLTGSVCLNLTSVQRADLEEVAQGLGFHALGDFISALSLKALTNPNSLEQIMFGQMQNETRASAKAELE